MSYLGEIRMFAGNFAPQGWAACNGQLLQIADNRDLFAAIGTRWGGDGTTTFGAPSLGATLPVGVGGAFQFGAVGSAAFASARPANPMTVLIALRDSDDQPNIGEIRTFAFGYTMDGWLPCEGQMLPIATYMNLFQVIGNTYGGDGQITFVLPDLRGAAAHGAPSGPSIGFLVMNLCIATAGVFPFRP